MLDQGAAGKQRSDGTELNSWCTQATRLQCVQLHDFFEGHGQATYGAGLLAIQPLVDAGQMEVVGALRPYLGILCMHTK